MVISRGYRGGPGNVYIRGDPSKSSYLEVVIQRGDPIKVVIARGYRGGPGNVYIRGDPSKSSYLEVSLSRSYQPATSQ